MKDIHSAKNILNERKNILQINSDLSRTLLVSVRMNEYITQIQGLSALGWISYAAVSTSFMFIAVLTNDKKFGEIQQKILVMTMVDFHDSFQHANECTAVNNYFPGTARKDE